MSNKTQQISREYETINKKYISINQKFVNEPDVYAKKVAMLAQQIKEYEVTFNNLIADVGVLKETNRQLQERCVQKQRKSIKHNMSKKCIFLQF